MQEQAMVKRSFIIPVLSMGDDDRFNIHGLLNDLETVDGEVICIFNSDDVFDRLRTHPRITKFCYNKHNAGVSRSWNMGIQLADGETVFIVNEDVHMQPIAVGQMEHYLYSLPKAVMVSPQGAYVDFQNLRVVQYFQKGRFEQPVRTHDVSGFLFAIHMERYHTHRLMFDVRYSPCFMEEWDMGMQVMKAGLACYAVPVTAFDHEWGISGSRENSPIHYFGKTVFRDDVLLANRKKFIEKWHPQATAPKSRPKITTAARTPERLYLGLSKGDNFGWGVCSRYLIRELSKKVPAQVLNPNNGNHNNPALKGKLFQALKDVHFNPMFEHARGKENYAYTFFENELTHASVENAKKFDLVLGGSRWCRDRMLEKGIENCDVLIQGIDPDLFFPIETQSRQDRFVIFSGGKFELRKGQDLVLRAVKILQDKYPDVWLLNCWYNMWPASTRLMSYSRHIRFEYRENESWQDAMQRTYQQNGLDPERIITCDLVPHERQRELFAQTDVGVFPNRCEGGTNLVLMEYMACAKPVVASNTSGHRDILTPDNALQLNQLSDFNVENGDGNLIGRWQEPLLEELVNQLEWAYHHRERLIAIGKQAGQDLKGFTWRHSADSLVHRLYN
jgi:glycosyltransferase involved in cell wall biosynthesis/GT2 family glycosyltransferase